jgi:hypothetical protein
MPPKGTCPFGITLGMVTKQPVKASVELESNMPPIEDIKRELKSGGCCAPPRNI